MTGTLRSEERMLRLGGRQIEVVAHHVEGVSRSMLVLHEALGSVTYWRDFPQQLALATGCNTIVYSRGGHGSSEGPLGLRDAAHYRRELEEIIPGLLDAFHIDRPLMYGHSEGAGISLMFAALTQRPLALILESPMVVAAESSGMVIRKMTATYPGSKLQQSLARYHQDPDGVFYAWSDWAAALAKDNFHVLDYVAGVTCPTLVLQGELDWFEAQIQMDSIQSVAPGFEMELFPEAAHLIHRDCTDALLKRVATFVAELPAA
jgi:pimeloyl-ACP methyl ester carboxylesterase